MSRKTPEIRTGTCTGCGTPVTADQSATDTRRWNGRHDLRHISRLDCPNPDTAEEG